MKTSQRRNDVLRAALNTIHRLTSYGMSNPGLAKMLPLRKTLATFYHGNMFINTT